MSDCAFSTTSYGIVVDIAKVDDLDRFYAICRLIFKHLITYPTESLLVKYYYSSLSLDDIEKDIIVSEEYVNNNQYRAKVRDALKSKIGDDYSIISNNCMGNIIVKITSNPKNLSPTVNSIIRPDDFIKYVSNLEYYSSLTATPNITESLKRDYAVVDLGDIQIYFTHVPAYMCIQEADHWNQRSKRINYNKILIVYHDRQDGPRQYYGSDRDIISEISKLSYSKIIITPNTDIKVSNVIHTVDPFNMTTLYDQISRINTLII